MYNQGYKPAGRQQEAQRQYAQGAWYAPPQEQNSQSGQPLKRAGGKQGKKPGRMKWGLIKALLIVILIAGFAAGGYILKTRSDVKPYTSVFVDNIYIDGIDVGGMTMNEAFNTLHSRIGSTLTGWYIRLKSPAGGYKDITAATLGISYDPSAALSQAWELGHDTGSDGKRRTIFELSKEIESVKSRGASFSSVRSTADLTPIDTILATLKKAAYRAPLDAEILGFDPDRADPFTFRDEVWGQELKTDDLRERILSMVSSFESGEILVQPTTIAPKVTVAELRKEVSLLFRARTPIASNSTEDRNNNIRVAFSKINGMVLSDGEKFSFNKVVGRRTVKNGFFTAFEYNYGELVDGVGGGVCQASTTVYLAAIQAGMTIVDRTAHSTPVTYTEMGKDATVSDTRGREIDFVFRNKTGSNVFLTAHVYQDANNRKRFMCEVCIYGRQVDGVRYELEAELTQKILAPTEPEYIKDTNHKYTTAPGEEVTVIDASDGYVVDTYLCTIVNGVQTERKKISTDTYKSRAERIYVGVE